MKKFITMILLATICFAPSVKADEGMWLLPFIKQNIKDMKKKGFKLSAEDIYSLNKSCIKDAIVIFGRGCTGEIISSKGLLLTNHHCGYSSIQEHSTVEHDYLKNGFWAMSQKEEIPTPGLEVRFVRHIKDVTAEVFNGVTDNTAEEERAKIMNANLRQIADAESAKFPNLEISVKDFFGGNTFLLFGNEVFNDVRMVGAPPSSIGKFGGETDNWMWPRHTCDFSLFRVYCAPDGSPASYASENVPYTPKRSLKISLNGFKENDFAMILGFPGSTERYMSSFEIEKTLKQDNPNRIKIRGIRQGILSEAMRASDKVRIQYATKYAQSSNYWKNSIGASRGLEKLNVKAQKEAIEAKFDAWVKSDPANSKYANALSLKREAIAGMAPHENVMQILNEALFSGSEIIMLSSSGSRLFGSSTDMSPEYKEKVLEVSEKMYKDYDPTTDRKVAKAMFKVVKEMLSADELPSIFATEIDAKFNGNTDKYVDYLYDNSMFSSKEKFDAFVNNADIKKLQSDPAIAALNSIRDVSRTHNNAASKYSSMYSQGHRLFVDGYQKMESGKKHYPDANFTMRMTYGQVLPYRPFDGAIYDYKTTLKGVMDKEDPKNPVDFTVEPRLKELYKNKDFGRYAVNGEMPVAFMSNNDITGGNSGSPVLNGKGELIGVAFDGNWEAMSGDIAFEPALQRTISVDIRYVLFIIDKYAGCQRLIDEMDIVQK